MSASLANELLAFATGFPATPALFAAGLVRTNKKTGETVLAPKGVGSLVLLKRKTPDQALALAVATRVSAATFTFQPAA